MGNFYSGWMSLSRLMFAVIIVIGGTACRSSLFFANERDSLDSPREGKSSAVNNQDQSNSDQGKESVHGDPLEELTKEVGVGDSGGKNTTPQVPIKDNCPVDWNSVVEAEDFACFQSVQEVFANIPDKARPYWMLVHESESNQRASLEYPRIIVNAPTGKFIVTAETTPGASNIEVAIFNFDKNTWDFAGITFEKNGQRKVETELCKGCHGDRTRPIWRGYKNWGGVFGNEDDIKANEIELLKKFRSGQGSDLYKHLIFARGYNQGNSLRVNVNYRELGNNQIMNLFLARNSGRLLAAEIMANPEISNSQRIEISHTLVCEDQYSGRIVDVLNSYGYDYYSYLSFHKVSTGAPKRFWVGHQFAHFFAGILLLDAMLSEFPELGNKLPSLQAELEDPLFDVLRIVDLSEHRGWYNFDFDWLSRFMKDGDNRGLLSCAEMANMY